MSILQVDIKLLKKQIKSLLRSRMEEESKDGLHAFLGDVLDYLTEDNSVTLTKWRDVENEKN